MSCGNHIDTKLDGKVLIVFAVPLTEQPRCLQAVCLVALLATLATAFQPKLDPVTPVSVCNFEMRFAIALQCLFR